MSDHLLISKLLDGFNSITYAEKLVAGSLHGLQFARDFGGQRASIITRKEEWLSTIESELDIENQIYHQGYLIGLELALQTIESSITHPRDFQPSELFPDQVQFDLNWQQIFIHGIQDALAFTSKYQNHLSEITDEFETIKRRVFDLNKSEPNFSRTTKGEYQRGYLTGLEVTMKIIAKATG